MKSIKKFLIAIMIILFWCNGTEAMNDVQSSFTDEFRKSIVKWPIIHPFASQEEMDFYNNFTWYPDLTLEQNQKKLVSDFAEECFDFSFKIKPMGLKEIDIGYLDSEEHLIFASESLYVSTEVDSTSMIIYNDYNDKGLSLHCNTSSFIGYYPVDKAEKYKDQFLKCFSKIAEDPVGCKLFRIAITKHVVNDLEKIVVIPAVSYEEDKQSTIACSSGHSLCYHLAKLKNVEAIKRLKQDRQYRFITFSPEFFTENLPVCVIKCINDNILMDTVEFSKESALFHEIVHSLHKNVHKELLKSKNIKRRSKPIIIKYILEKEDPFYVRKDKINVGLFHNDEEYRTMYGITTEGLDLLNESAFCAHTCGFIRAAHADIQEFNLLIGKTKFGTKESVEFFQDFFKKHGDHDLFRYYLAPNSPIKYPKFGVGQYKCADLNSETGEKILQKDIKN